MVQTERKKAYDRERMQRNRLQTESRMKLQSELILELTERLEWMTERYVAVCECNTSEAWDASEEVEVVMALDLVKISKARFESLRQ